MSIVYLDASAIVKLVADEEHSAPARRYVEASDRVATSRVGLVEATRAIRRRILADPVDLERLTGTIAVLELTGSMSAVAATLAPPTLRSLDAIHVATALEFGGELDAFVTYDDRLADAARAAGLPVVSPG